MPIKFVLAAALIIITSAGCRKPAKLNDHDTIAGKWHVKKITGMNGFGNNTPLEFGTGDYIFNADGTFEYNGGTRELYKGSWLLYEKPDETYTDDNGNTVWYDGGYTVLELEAAKTSGTTKKTAYFVQFTLTDVDNFTVLLCPNGVATHQYSFTRLK
ncbi:hypothetical protein [Ferruginibacter sp.]